MKVLITGADGFIGSHLAERLTRCEQNVTALALYNSFDSYGWLDECEGMEKVRGDVRDLGQMMELVKGHDLVFHLAALISVPYSQEAPRSFVETNVLGTLNILEAARKHGAKVVHTSTSEVYGTAIRTPQDESHPLQAQSPYAASKIAGDKLVESYHLSYGLPAIVLRPFNTYGPRQSERAVIPWIIRQALDPQCEEIRLGNLGAKRDFNHVSDTVAAFIKAGELVQEEDFVCQVYNAGSGKSHKILDVVNTVKHLTKCDKPVTTKGERAAEVEVLQCDPTRFHEATGWKSRMSLTEGIQKTIDWWRSREFRKDTRLVA